MSRSLNYSWLSLLLVSCQGNQPGLRWVVPENFNGCVRMEFHVPGAPALPLEEGMYTITLTEPGGLLQTSTRPQWGEGLKDAYLRQRGTTRENIEESPTCHTAGTITHVDRGTVELRKCFGQVPEEDCEKAGGYVPRGSRNRSERR
ncbi:hypothetical protein ACLESD_02775 [Pyxidicoccus sp. 3LFB2]